MGVYIEGAKLPKNCEECNFKVECRPYWERVREEYTRPYWCPCVELIINGTIVAGESEQKMCKFMTDFEREENETQDERIEE